MGAVVMASIVRRIVQVADGPEAPEALLASVGLDPDVAPADATREVVEADAYYGLIERATAEDDDGLPFRYADVLRPDDLGALGLAFKTASTAGEALHRLARYILVVTDTLEYDLRDDGLGGVVELVGRPHHRRGARIANECALAAITSVLRQVAGPRASPAAVSFRHARPPRPSPHRRWFGCPVTFSAPLDGLRFTDRALATPARLADEGLSAFLLARLDELHAQSADRSLAALVQGAVTDSLPDGPASKAEVARRLGMSERTLHRRLRDEGETYQALATRARREAAEALLAGDQHTLGEIAFLTGFSDQSAFQRAFKRWTGQTPLGFRATASA